MRNQAGSDQALGRLSGPPGGDVPAAIRRVSVTNPAAPGRPASFCLDGGYLVDPASSHMLVSKIKPCMSKYKQLYGETANGSLNQL